MSKRLSTRDRFLLIFLLVLLIGVCYYLFYFKPLQTELANIDTQIQELEAEIEVSMTKIGSMNSMQAELDEILSRPESEITEIAPFDNAKVVMTQLNGIVRSSENYSLSFKDPEIQDDGTVRRIVSMTFSCKDYASAKSIIQALSSSRWRCLITSVAIASETESRDVTADIMTQPVSVSASIVFFESTKLA